RHCWGRPHSPYLMPTCLDGQAYLIVSQVLPEILEEEQILQSQCRSL
ncbi:hypothetical protein AVEN_273312-1, partial [Araneus ventricosus]